MALWKVKPTLDPPTPGIWVGPGAHAAADGVWLGSLAELTAGRVPTVWVSTAKEQVIGLVGKRGSGKSFTLGVLVEGLALTSDAPHVVKRGRPRATLLFDPLDVYWPTRFPVSPNINKEAKRHFDMAKAAKLTDLSFEVTAWVPGETSRRSHDPNWFQVLRLPVPAMGLEEWATMLDLNMFSDPMGQALSDALRLTTVAGFATVSGKQVAPTKRFGIPELLTAIDSEEIQRAYHPETLRAIRQRLTHLDSTGLFSSDGVEISELIAAGRLTVILLSRLPSAYKSAVVALLTRLVIDERSRVTFAEKRLVLDPTLSESERSELEGIIAGGAPRTTIALDEAQGFLGPGAGNPARDLFIRLVKEGRNIGLSAIVATQQPSALDRRILSQVETLLAHQLVTEPDIEAVRENLKTSVPEAIEYGRDPMTFAQMLRSLAPGQCVASAADMNTVIRRCVAVDVRPRATVHGGLEL